MEAVETAKSMGLTVSCDLNYRSMLWTYGKSAPEVMGRIAERTDLLIGNEEDFQKSLAIPFSVDLESGKLSTDAYRGLAEKALDRYPNVRRVGITLRSSRSADHNDWQAVLHNRESFLVSTQYEIGAIVDRVGSGDSFTAGLIYGLAALGSDQDALEFAVASGCLKHTIPGDFPAFSTGEVEALRAGKGSGRIQR
jgi:2-dehydro-3-deoxygluconokinase